MKALTLPVSINEQGKIWEEGMKEEREKEKKGEERVLKLQ